MMTSLFKGSVQETIACTPTHLYIAPHALLKPYIAHYTLTFSGIGALPDYLNLIPDASGCMVFTFDGNTLKSLFWGPTTKTQTVTNDKQNIPLRFFIEFNPGGAHQLLGFSLKDLTDKQYSVDIIQADLSKNITAIFETVKTLQTLIDAVNALLLKHVFSTSLPKSSALFLPKLDYTFNLSSKALAERTGYSERQLNRLFSNVLGLSCKTYTRLLRINHAFSKIQEHDINFTTLAHELGYYDQAHFNHDFKTVCGVTPTDYLKKMAHFYNEDYKF